MKPLSILIDANNVAHAMRHALSDSIDKRGYRTGALTGTLGLIRRLMLEFDPDEITLVWDGERSTEPRQQMYTKYKEARRKKQEALLPSELEEIEEFYSKQVPDIITATHGFGIPNLSIPYLEADDTIGVITTTGMQRCRYLIVTTDKDALQLVNEDVRVYNFVSKTLFFCGDGYSIESNSPNSEKHVIAPSPETYLLMRAFIGDKSDNIDGVIGIGETTVKKLVDKLGYIPYGSGKFQYNEYINSMASVATMTPRVGAKKAQDILKSADVVTRNMNLSRLGASSMAVAAARKLSAIAALFVNTCKKSRMTANARIKAGNYCSFLNDDPRSVTTPLALFFAARSFGLAYDIHERATLKREMTTLHIRHEDLCTGTEKIGAPLFHAPGVEILDVGLRKKTLAFGKPTARCGSSTTANPNGGRVGEVDD